ncbi:MAG: HAD-IA family hydrolase [Oscillospiraceae bacterium]|nr:HAD-IA family hydrolase [Oscillospiraceae bacterium]
MLKHFIWDFDGTLFNSYPTIVEAFRRALEEYGHTTDKEDIFSRMIITIPSACAYYQEKFGLPDEAIDRFRALQRELEPEYLIPMEGAAELCEEIVRRGGKNYIYTHRGTTAHDHMHRWDMDAFFTEYVTNADTAFDRKPSPASILYLMEKYGMDPKETVMIGDRPLDVQSGKNAGVFGCFFDSGNTGTDGGADWIIHSLCELKKYW